jgi:hypothetical protein
MQKDVCATCEDSAELGDERYHLAPESVRSTEYISKEGEQLASISTEGFHMYEVLVGIHRYSTSSLLPSV